MMKFNKGEDYSIIDNMQNEVIRIYGIKQLDNWYLANIRQLSLTEKLHRLFDEVESLVKNHDVKSMLETEKKILACGLKIGETNDLLNEVQLSKKNKLYFKISGIN